VREKINRFYRSLDRPLHFRSRFVLGLLVIPLALAFSAPLWIIAMEAPQYPEGLRLEIYAHTVGGDVNEVNTLNHYIGMGTIDRASLSDLDWIPFALGALILLGLRVAAIGDIRSLADLLVLFVYFSAFSMARFAYRLYVFGHDLDPKAPFDVEPFTPAILGSKTVANFTITSFPGGATLWVGLFGLGLVAVTLWNMSWSWRHSHAT
jgi:hypothetical protein